MRFNPGDLAIAINSRYGRKNCIVEIVGTDPHRGCYVISSSEYPNVCFAFSDQLKPFYDGNQKTEWEDCVWQPKELVV